MKTLQLITLIILIIALSLLCFVVGTFLTLESNLTPIFLGFTMGALMTSMLFILFLQELSEKFVEREMRMQKEMIVWEEKEKEKIVKNKSEKPETKPEKIPAIDKKEIPAIKKEKKMSLPILGQPEIVEVIEPEIVEIIEPEPEPIEEEVASALKKMREPRRF